MMAIPSLIPKATPLERALDVTTATRLALPAGDIAQIADPDTCPAHLLPYLAWDLSIDLWDADWSETKQRQVCRDALRLHRLKTTPAGIRAHVAIAGGVVDRIVRPPARGFLRDTRTPDEQAAWLDRLPQIRIYPFATRSMARRRSFCTGLGARHQFGSYLRDSIGARLFGRRATYVADGVETPVTLANFDGGAIQQIAIGGVRPHRSYAGSAFASHGWLVATDAGDRMVTVRFDDDAPAFAISRGVTPVDVLPTRVARTSVASRHRAFLGRRGGFLMHSAAAGQIYDRVSLHDAAALGASRRVSTWGGHGRMGGAPFTAEVRISVPIRRARRSAARWNGVGFLRDADMSALARIIEAVGTAKAARDTILIDTTTHAIASFGGGLRFGDFRFGDIRKV